MEIALILPVIIIIIALLKCVFFKRRKIQEPINIEEQHEILKNRLREEKIRNYIEQMTLLELTQLLSDDTFTKIPLKRSLIEEAVFKKVLSGEIELKDNNLVYYIDSDKVAENDKNYYYENIKEKESDVKKFDSIRKEDDGIVRKMDLSFNSLGESYVDIDTKITEEFIKNNLPKEECSLEERIKVALTLEPIKENYQTFQSLLNEYNLLDFDSKAKISRKYTSELESLRNKAQRAK